MLLVALSSFSLVSAKWREAVAENRRAEGNLSLALESMDQILERFASGWMAHPSAIESDGESTASDVEFQIAVSDHSAEVLQDALRFYDQFAKQNATNSELQRDTAKVHRRVADIYERLGQYTKAEEAYKRSLVILDSEPIDDEAELAIERASTLNQLGLTMYATSRFDEAKIEFLRAKETLSGDAISDEPRCRAELARINNNLGQTLWLMRSREEAIQSHQRAVEILEDLVGQHPQDTDFRLALARAYRIYYPCVVFGKEKVDHEKIRSAGISILEKLVHDYPNVPDYQCELSEMLTATSFCRRDARKREEQARRLERAVALAKGLTESHPSIPRYRAVLARTLKELAQMHGKLDRGNARDRYLESVSIYRSLAQDFADIPVYHMFLAMALKDHGVNLREMGRITESQIAIEEGISEQDAYVRLRPGSRFGRGMLARLHEELAVTLSDRDAV